MSALSPRLRPAVTASLAAVGSYWLAFAWSLDRPFWAGFTVFVISLPSFGQSLQKGLMRAVGTLCGAGIGLGLFVVFHDNRAALLVSLSVYLSAMMAVMIRNRQTGYSFYISSVVTMVIVLMGAQDPHNAFSIAISRLEETFLGITVYTLLALVLLPQSSDKVFLDDIRTIMNGHARLGVYGQRVDTASTITDIHGQYAAIEAARSAALLMLPAVALEHYAVHASRPAWREVIEQSRHLATIQRRWATLLVGLREVPPAQIFPDFDVQLAALQEDLKNLAQAMDPAALNEATDLQQDIPALSVDEQAVSALPLPEQSLVSALQPLYVQQRTVARHLAALLPVLLALDAPDAQGRQNIHLLCVLRTRLGDIKKGNQAESRRVRPALSLSAGLSGLVPGLLAVLPRISPEQRTAIASTMYSFWPVVLIWIEMTPPGARSGMFCELTVLMGTATILAPNLHPGKLLRDYTGGVLVALCCYFFIYPHLTTWAQLAVMLFVVTVVVSYIWHRPDQTLSKIAYLIPFLALSDYTNMPLYDPVRVIQSAFSLLAGVGLVALMRYVFLYRNHDTAFIRSQYAFCAALEQALNLLARAEQTGDRFARLRLEFALHQLRGHAESATAAAAQVREDFVPRDALAVLGMEFTELTHSLRLLHQELDELERNPQARQLMNAALADWRALPPAATSPETLERIRSGIADLLQTVHGHAAAQAEAAPLTPVIARYGNVLKSLSSALDILHSIAWNRAAADRF